MRVGAVCALLSAVGSNQARIGEAAGEPLQMLFSKRNVFGGQSGLKRGPITPFVCRSGCGRIKRQGVSGVILHYRALTENGAEVMWVVDQLEFFFTKVGQFLCGYDPVGVF